MWKIIKFVSVLRLSLNSPRKFQRVFAPFHLVGCQRSQSDTEQPAPQYLSSGLPSTRVVVPRVLQKVGQLFILLTLSGNSCTHVLILDTVLHIRFERLSSFLHRLGCNWVIIFKNLHCQLNVTKVFCFLVH